MFQSLATFDIFLLKGEVKRGEGAWHIAPLTKYIPGYYGRLNFLEVNSSKSSPVVLNLYGL